MSLILSRAIRLIQAKYNKDHFVNESSSSNAETEERESALFLWSSDEIGEKGERKSGGVRAQTHTHTLHTRTHRQTDRHTYNVCLCGARVIGGAGALTRIS